jgi:hypothetical protein
MKGNDDPHSHQTKGNNDPNSHKTKKPKRTPATDLINNAKEKSLRDFPQVYPGRVLLMGMVYAKDIPLRNANYGQMVRDRIRCVELEKEDGYDVETVDDKHTQDFAGKALTH